MDFDFKIDENLIKFNNEVPPAVGSMQSQSQKIIEKNKKVSETSDACGDGMSGSYQTNNTAQAVQPYKDLAEGCKKIANEVQSKMIPLLAECSALGALIAELIALANEGRALQATIRAKESADPPQDASAERARLTQVIAEFKQKHEEAKAKLEELKGKDTSISNMKPTNGSLSVDPAIAADVQKGHSGRDQYYNYSTGDQSITSIGS